MGRRLAKVNLSVTETLAHRAHTVLASTPLLHRMTGKGKKTL